MIYCYRNRGSVEVDGFTLEIFQHTTENIIVSSRKTRNTPAGYYPAWFRYTQLSLNGPVSHLAYRGWYYSQGWLSYQLIQHINLS